MNDVKEIVPKEILSAIDLILNHYGLSLSKLVSETKEEGYMTLQEVAKMTTLSKITIQRAIKAGKLQAIKTNHAKTGRLLFKRPDVEAWIDETMIKVGQKQ